MKRLKNKAGWWQSSAGTLRVVFVCLLFGNRCSLAQTERPLHLRFAEPATKLTEAIPLGNGRLGASPFEGVDEDRILLNENSMWSGSRKESDKSDAAQYLPEIRRLLLAGDNVAAEELVNEHFTSLGKGSDSAAFGNYQELGSLLLHFDYGAPVAATDYQRSLDLRTAVSRCRFLRGGVTYTRETFVSAPDQVIVVRLTASAAHHLSLTVGLSRAGGEPAVRAVSASELEMTGQLVSGQHDETTRDGLRYAARVRVVARGGHIASEGNQLRVTSADEVLLLIAGATNYQGFTGRRSKDAGVATATDLTSLRTAKYDALLAREREDYGRLFRTMSLELGSEAKALQQDAMLTPARLAAAAEGGDDPEFAALYLQFGRYLLISSSRPGGFPANLQGIWAEGTSTAWNGDWHLNINVQMNYWPAETTGLSPLTEPLFALIRSLIAPGERTAKAYYGASGWVAHVMTNPWGFTSPGQVASWGSTTIGSGWLCQHILDHYRYMGDKAFLRQMYPVLKSASEFYLAMLIAEPKHGWLVTAPSNSPENSFYLADGQKASVVMGPAIDSEVLHALFAGTADAARDLRIDDAFADRLRDTELKLAPIQIGRDGRVMEWLEPYREVEVHHRHVSHLWALYPGDAIDVARTPELAAAARKSLEERGDASTGWSLANKLNLWARLGDGEHCYGLLRLLWRPAEAGGGGSYRNLLDAHPPFQIDGNFGGAAGIEEMLLQSRVGELTVLPALPAEWGEGAARGLRARGGEMVDLRWSGGRLTQLRLTGGWAGEVKVKYQGRVMVVPLRPGEVKVVRLE